MRAKVLTATCLLLALVVTAFWLYVRSDGRQIARLHFFLSGDWTVKLRNEEPGSRNPHADSFGLAYRLSAYRSGRYLGCYTREGHFQATEQDQNTGLVDYDQMTVALRTIRAAPFAALVFLVLGVAVGAYAIYNFQLTKGSSQ